MRLMTHNLLMCNKKGCTINNFPLVIKPTKIITNSVEFDEDLIKRFLKKLDFTALTSATKDVKLNFYFRWISTNLILKNYQAKN